MTFWHKQGQGMGRCGGRGKRSFADVMEMSGDHRRPGTRICLPATVLQGVITADWSPAWAHNLNGSYTTVLSAVMCRFHL